MENLDIFISAYKDFELPVKNPSYRVIDSRIIKKIYKVNGDFDDKDIGEHYQLSFVKNFVELKDYVGTCHYRRYFEFLDNIPDMNEIFNNEHYDVILPAPIQYGVSNRKMYETCHNIEDVEIAEFIIKHKFPDYYQSFVSFFNSKSFFPFSIFIMKKDDFIKYEEFMEKFIKEWANIVGTDMRQRVIDNSEKYLKGGNSANNTIEYQKRLLGYLLERLSNVFIFNNFKKLRFYKIKVVE